MGALTDAVQLALAFVLLIAGTAKLRQLARFRTAVADYAILPARLVGGVAVAVPVAEILVGVSMLIGFAARPAAVLAAGLFGAFAGAMVVNLARGRSIECGCLGLSAETPVGWGLVMRNGVLAVLALGVASTTPAEQPTPVIPAIVAAAAALMLLAVAGSAARTWAAVGRLGPGGTPS